MRSAERLRDCLLIGLDRKWSAYGQNGAIDPARHSSDAISINDLHTLHPGCSLSTWALQASRSVPVLRVRTLAQGDWRIGMSIELRRGAPDDSVKCGRICFEA